MPWTITYNGTEKTPADWGLKGFKLRRRSQGADELTFIAEGAAMDSTEIFPWHGTITVQKNRSYTGSAWVGGFIKFVGLIIQTPGSGAPQGEQKGYTAVGPWWYLENLVFQQAYKNVFLGYSSGTPVFGQAYSSHLFLSQGFNTSSPHVGNPWLKITTGQEITEALNWCLSPWTSGYPFQIGTIGPAVDCPVDEVRDITCAEVIHKMLRWTPDAVTWFDYTTSPPTFNCKQRSSLTAITVPITGSNLASITVNPRNDLRAPFVSIFYETSSTVNGQQSLSLSTDTYPTSPSTAPLDQFAALEFTVDLQGQVSNTVSATLAVETIAANTSAWWLEKHPQFNTGDAATTITSITIDTTTLTRTPSDGGTDQNYTRELKSGQLADWMTSIGAQRITFKVKASVVYANGHTVPDLELSYQCLSTNATAGTFYNTTTTQFAEPVPVGLAQAIYNAINPLQYEGSITLQDAEVGDAFAIGPGNTLNISGSSQSAWSTMNALIYETIEDLDAGTTQVNFGPVKYLGAGDLVNLLRVNRARIIRGAFSMRPSGSTSAGSNTSLGNNTPEKNSVIGGGPSNPHVVSENPNGTGALITHTASAGDCTITLNTAGGSTPIVIQLSAAAGNTMTIRQLAVCQDGVPGSIYVLASAFIPS